MNRKSLARTSAQPGKTQTINFYNINDEMYFVDLPGYGYAKVSASEKEKWGKMIERYLHKSKQLKAVFLLIDIRHEPGANDKHMYQWILEQGFEPVIIATKLDKINRSQIQKHIKMLKTGLVDERSFNFQYKEINEQVEVMNGPFEGFVGTVQEISKEKHKVKVLVSMFGRETPVELEFSQVKKVQ